MFEPMTERNPQRQTASLESLNGLPDRFEFIARLGNALAGESPVAVLFIDVDGLKDVNDSFGHALGDQLLVAVCQRLTSVLPPDALLARFAGDEFLVLNPNARNSRDAAQLAERLIERLRQMFFVDGNEVRIGANVGVALSSPLLVRAEDLLRASDIALHEAKARGPGTFRIFELEMLSRLNDRLTLETELRRAIDRNELCAFYQPQVDLNSGAIVGVEALVRWQHPRRGLISAGEFVSIAEQTGLILPIGSWMLDEACRQVAKWRAAYPAGRRLAIAVNFSGRQLRQLAFVEDVVATANRHGIPINRLEFELTERAVVEDAQQHAAALQHLRRRKAKLVIDDFGTGYSSLRYLRGWPIDRVKIDRNFLADIELELQAQHLVEAMIELTRALGAEVTAEGVETPGQVALLRAFRVERAQGFSFSPPLPPAELGTLLRDDHRYVLPPPALLGRSSRRVLRRGTATGPLV